MSNATSQKRARATATAITKQCQKGRKGDGEKTNKETGGRNDVV